MKKIYTVCWIEDSTDDGQIDHYEVFMEDDSETNLKEAKKRYKQLLKRISTYSLNLCEIIKSTDY